MGFPNGIGEPPPEVLEAKRKLYAVEEQKARDIKALEAVLEEHGALRRRGRAAWPHSRRGARAQGRSQAMIFLLYILPGGVLGSFLVVFIVLTWWFEEVSAKTRLYVLATFGGLAIGMDRRADAL